MKQRAALLRTYMFETEVMLLDEPFSALDAITRNEMQQWFLNLVKTHKKSTIFITHDIDEAILLSDRIYIMAGSPGKIVAEICIDNKKDSEFTVSNKFLEYKQKILDILKN